MARDTRAPVLYLLLLVLVTGALLVGFALQNPAQSLHLLGTNADNNREQKPVEDHAAVQGDYLLGVGKADITG